MQSSRRKSTCQVTNPSLPERNSTTRYPIIPICHNYLPIRVIWGFVSATVLETHGPSKDTFSMVLEPHGPSMDTFSMVLEPHGPSMYT